MAFASKLAPTGEMRFIPWDRIYPGRRRCRDYICGVCGLPSNIESPTGLVALKQPATCAWAQLGHLVSAGIVHRLENLQLLAGAREDPRIALLGLFQPHAVVFAAHRGTIARQTQRITIVFRKTLHTTIRHELHGAALAVAADDGPFAAQISAVQGFFKTAARRSTRRSRGLRFLETLFRARLAGGLNQLIALDLQVFHGVVVVDAQLAIGGAGDLAFANFEPVRLQRLTGL